MASTGIYALTRFTALAAGDVIPGVHLSDTSQNAHGSLDAITVTNFFASIPVPVNITSASATALAVGRLGATTPAFTVDASTASQVAGLKVVGAVTTGTVAVVVTDSGAVNTNLTINALGTGTIGIGSVSTGRVTITPVTTITGLLTVSAGLVVAASQAITGTVASSTITGFLSVTATTFVGALTGNVSGTAGSTTTVTTGGTVTTGALTATTGLLTATGYFLQNSAASTTFKAINIINTGGGIIIGNEGSLAGQLIVGSTAYDATIVGTTGLSISANGGTNLHMRITSTGAATLSSTLGVTGLITATGGVSGALTGNVTGNVSGTAATVTGAAQTAITSVGTLSGLTVTATITGSVSGSAATVTGGTQASITSAANLVTVGNITSGGIGFGFGNIDIHPNNLSCGGFGCNGKTPQTAYASGGVLANVVTALVANGILSS